MIGAWRLGLRAGSFFIIDHADCEPPPYVSGLRVWGLQGYLADKNTTTPRGPPSGPRHRPTVGSYGTVFSYERATPVGLGFSPPETPGHAACAPRSLRLGMRLSALVSWKHLQDLGQNLTWEHLEDPRPESGLGCSRNPEHSTFNPNGRRGHRTYSTKRPWSARQPAWYLPPLRVRLFPLLRAPGFALRL